MTPAPSRILLRGLLWGPLLGGALGAAVWVVLCTVTLAVGAMVFAVVAFVVGAVVGLLPGLLAAGVLALAARRSPVHESEAAGIAAVVCGGAATGLAVVGLLAGEEVAAMLVWWVVATAVLAATGALGGVLVTLPARSRRVGPSPTARRNGAAAAAGTASPGWSRAPGR